MKFLILFFIISNGISQSFNIYNKKSIMKFLILFFIKSNGISQSFNICNNINLNMQHISHSAAITQYTCKPNNIFTNTIKCPVSTVLSL